MSLAESLAQHLRLCDELHALTLEENKLLKQTQTPPGAAWRARKEDVAARFAESLEALKAAPRPPGTHGGPELERARERSLQILMLDKENEQLLLRCSLSSRSPHSPAPNRPSGAAAARIYKHS